MKPRGYIPDVAPWSERRRDEIMSDVVDIGVIFVDVFGPATGLTFFQCTIVAQHVYERVLLGPRRRVRQRRKPDDFDFVG